MTDGTVTTTTLYGKDSKGKIRQWAIHAEDYHIIIEHGLLDGKLVRKTELVKEGKQSRTRHEQVVSMLLSRIKKQKDKGYVEDLETCRNEQRTNALGLVRPMLAKPIDKRAKDCSFWGAMWQRKLDGHRALITRRDGTFVAYSRNGKGIDLPHLSTGLNLEEGETIDGEVYIHGKTLQEISSLIKKPREESLVLRFHAYDFVSPDSYQIRLNHLKRVLDGAQGAVLHETYSLDEGHDMYTLTETAISEGFEGGIVRLAGFGYQDGARSTSLLKIKKFEDSEHVVLDIVPSKDQHAILCLATDDGKEFRCNAPGGHAARSEVWENRDKYLGRSVQIRYSVLTPDGIPFHPVPSPAGWVDRGELG